MTHQNRLVEYSLYIPPKMWQEFRQNMLDYRNSSEEVIGFFFCKPHQVSKRKIRYIPKAWVVPSPDCYEMQSVSGLVLTQQFHFYLLKQYLKEGLHVVHIHTHVGEIMPEFSSVDNYYEADYARFLAQNFPKKPRLISGVFNQSLQQSQFRIWDRKGKKSHDIKFSTNYLETMDSLEGNFKEHNIASTIQNYGAIDMTQLIPNDRNLMFARQKVFGETCQKHLGELKVSLIGCGGIGSIFAELLGRLGVKNWTLIDSDRIEAVNLNRMPGATQKMVEQRWKKIDYVKHLIKKIYQTGSCITTIPTSIDNEVAKLAISTSDLIVVATDNHLSRKIAQELALEYMHPLICLGTHIDMNQCEGKPRMFCRITIPPLGGGWCLMCGNIINLQKAAVESAPVQINQMVANAGYLEGVNDPAVFWLNSICASTAVGVIHGIVSGFLNVDAGIDWVYEFPNSVWHQTNIEYLETPDCYFCSNFDGFTAKSEEFFNESNINNMDYWL
ncbi:ThiF family adenylyltransferase [Scytonema sp. NUACC26]|uniref:ThiF family adenylyltransferase n=1 Tax=Scytonema sp. NUACC26 TaxID=3140176 RepID=UPI0034DB91A1